MYLNKNIPTNINKQENGSGIEVAWHYDSVAGYRSILLLRSLSAPKRQAQYVYAGNVLPDELHPWQDLVAFRPLPQREDGEHTESRRQVICAHQHHYFPR